MTMTLIRDKVLEVTEGTVLEANGIECEDDEQERYDAAVAKIMDMCNLAENLAEDFTDDVMKAYLADLKEVLDVADRYCEREISRMQQKLKRAYGGYDRMIMMEIPELDAEDFEELDS